MIDISQVSSDKAALDRHNIYHAITTIEQLQTFMEHHIYSVWDFMSLVKYLQNKVAPSHTPWLASSKPHLARFINEIILEEESDELPNGKGYLSHYEMYLKAMKEVGADTSKVESFVKSVQNEGIQKALASCSAEIPKASHTFMQTTFGYIDQEKPHIVAAAFSLGRETIIPLMFKRIVEQMGISKEEAPLFYYYLERHIHLDEGSHGPLAMELLEHLCEDDPTKIAEAIETAQSAIQARITFWDGVLNAIKK
jgi:hypothetical protein